MNTIELKKEHLQLSGFDDVCVENIVGALDVFLDNNEIQQVTFEFKTGVQAGIFGAFIQAIKAGGTYVFASERDNKNKSCELMFVRNWDLMLKSYMCIKHSNKVIASFYPDDLNKDIGYLTFIKGDFYEA